MGIQETAQDVLGLVQALAEGKTLEFRSQRQVGARWETFSPQAGVVSFNIDYYDYRIKRDLREELFDLVKKYGREMYHAGVAAGRGQDETALRAEAKVCGEKIELLVDMMLRGEK